MDDLLQPPVPEQAQEQPPEQAPEETPEQAPAQDGEQANAEQGDTDPAGHSKAMQKVLMKLGNLERQMAEQRQAKATPTPEPAEEGDPFKDEDDDAVVSVAQARKLRQETAELRRQLQESNRRYEGATHDATVQKTLQSWEKAMPSIAGRAAQMWEDAQARAMNEFADASPQERAVAAQAYFRASVDQANGSRSKPRVTPEGTSAIPPGASTRGQTTSRSTRELDDYLSRIHGG